VTLITGLWLIFVVISAFAGLMVVGSYYGGWGAVGGFVGGLVIGVFLPWMLAAIASLTARVLLRKSHTNT
jgi:hypothetical protein